MSHSPRRKALKLRVFERDGWIDENGAWRANCAFGCGEVLRWRSATLDRFPVMGKNGGTYVLENVRLACHPCNSSNKMIPHKSRRMRTRRGAERNQATSTDQPPLILETKSNPSPQYTEQTRSLLRINYPRNEISSLHGIPERYL